jgi:hypothetical protein
MCVTVFGMAIVYHGKINAKLNDINASTFYKRINFIHDFEEQTFTPFTPFLWFLTSFKEKLPCNSLFIERVISVTPQLRMSTVRKKSVNADV